MMLEENILDVLYIRSGETALRQKTIWFIMDDNRSSLLNTKENRNRLAKRLVEVSKELKKWKE